MAHTMLLPAAIRYLAELAGAASAELVGETEPLDRGARRRDRQAGGGQAGPPRGRRAQATALYMRDMVIPAMNEVRESADKLEKVVADDLWPLPKYAEMLFIR